MSNRGIRTRHIPVYSEETLGLACCQLIHTIEDKLAKKFPVVDKALYDWGRSNGINVSTGLNEVNSNYIDAVRKATTICVRDKIDLQTYRHAIDDGRTFNLDKLCDIAMKSKYFNEMVSEGLRNVVVKLVMDE